MKDLITDVKALHEETLNNLRNSKANNTIRAYKSDFKDFGIFCGKNGFKSLPTEPKIVSLYLSHLSIKNTKPIGNGIITSLNKKQALIRSNPKLKDKGGEAALAALSVLKIKK